MVGPCVKTFNVSESGADAPGMSQEGNASDSDAKSFEIPKRNQKEIPPVEAKQTASEIATRDQNSPGDAEFVWKMMYFPVCADAIRIEELSDLAIRFARRGLRWVQMARSRGLSCDNRRYR